MTLSENNNNSLSRVLTMNLPSHKSGVQILSFNLTDCLAQYKQAIKKKKNPPHEEISHHEIEPAEIETIK